MERLIELINLLDTLCRDYGMENVPEYQQLMQEIKLRMDVKQEEIDRLIEIISDCGEKNVFNGPEASLTTKVFTRWGRGEARDQ